MEFNKLVEIISEQQKGHENEDVFGIGEQLKDMAKGNAKITELLINDLTTVGMKLTDAGKMFKKHADGIHGNTKGKSGVVCITPKVADGLLRKFYGLPEAEEKVTVAAPVIDLSDFL